LGGVYPTLFPEHAERFSGADHIIRGEGEDAVARLIADLVKPSAAAPTFDLDDLDQLPAPTYDLLSSRDCLAFLTSRGCPHRCSYCASRQMFARFRRRDPLRAADHLIELCGIGCQPVQSDLPSGNAPGSETGYQPILHDPLAPHSPTKTICDVAFYDDALLADAPRHFIPFCDRLLAANLRARFHTPNGLDYAALDEAVAERLARLGFATIRLSLETANRERLRRLGREADLSRFEAALTNLAHAGFDLRQIGVYVLFGLPGQTRAEVEQSVDYVLALGATARLSEFSPLPFTAEWDKVRSLGNPPLEQEPLLTNNSVFYRLGDEFPDSWVNDLRRRIREAGLAGESND